MSFSCTESHIVWRWEGKIKNGVGHLHYKIFCNFFSIKIFQKSHVILVTFTKVKFILKFRIFNTKIFKNFHNFSKQLQHEFLTFKNSKFVSTVKLNPIEVCGGSKPRYLQFQNFQKLILKFFNMTNTEKTKCPFEGSFSIVNVTAPKDVVNILPLGKYMIKSTIYDDEENPILGTSLEFLVFE